MLKFLGTRMLTLPFLPPAYVVRTTGGYVFTGVCLFNFWGGGVPHHMSEEGVPHPRSRWGYLGYPPTMIGWGTPHPGLDGGGYPTMIE